MVVAGIVRRPAGQLANLRFSSSSGRGACVRMGYSRAAQTPLGTEAPQDRNCPSPRREPQAGLLPDRDRPVRPGSELAAPTTAARATATRVEDRAIQADH